ncbi:MAG: DsrE family protein [Chitinophagaceae bacterium]|jgi:intracellular sulfur oxidation DsrE/DsrF family protein|nr:DsrE family protein [Chitinophagaceae bacterium]
MRRLIFLAALFLSVKNIVFAQNPSNAQTREERFKKLESKMIFPVINAGYLSGVLPVGQPSEKPDPNAEVKLMFDFTQATSSGNQATKVNEGLAEVARVINLHAVAGTPEEKIKAVIVFHAASITTVMNDAFYQKQYQTNNPNALLLSKLNDLGCNLVICGQSLQLRDIPASNLLPFMKVAVAAKTTLTKYHQQGYFLFEIKGE